MSKLAKSKPAKSKPWHFVKCELDHGEALLTTADGDRYLVTLCDGPPVIVLRVVRWHVMATSPSPTSPPSGTHNGRKLYLVT